MIKLINNMRVRASLRLLFLAAALAYFACDITDHTLPDKIIYPHYDDGVLIDQNGRMIITQFGISWVFDRTYEYGRFANGDYWVIGPATIRAIFPGSRKISGRTKNGSMINPSPADGTSQGYDSACFATTYVPAMNAALNVSPKNPLVVLNGSSLVSTISLGPEGSRPQLRTAAVLTVLESAPPDGGFRPPYCGNDKSVDYNVSQLTPNLGLLAELDPPGETPDLPTIERYFERPWIDHVPGWSCGSIHPLENMQNYGRDLSHEMGAGALTLHVNLPEGESKQTLLVRFVQLGIDLYGVVQNGGRENWHNDGGHAGGRKWPILFAGIMLGDAGMQAIGSRSGDYLYDGDYGPGNIPGDYIHFGEDDQTFYVTADDIALGSVVTENPGGCSGSFHGHHYPPDCVDYPEYAASDLGLPEWGIRHASSPLNDGNTWNAAYRDCCTAISWTGFVLAARIMGAHTSLWNHPALFDYQDRYMAVTAAEDMAPAWRYSTDQLIEDSWGSHPGWRPGGFVGEMWDAYRDSY